MRQKLIVSQLQKFPDLTIIDLKQFNQQERRPRNCIWFGVQGLFSGWLSTVMDKNKPYLIHIQQKQWQNHKAILELLQQQGFNNIVDIFCQKNEVITNNSLFQSYKPNIATRVIQDGFFALDVRTKRQWEHYGCAKSQKLVKMQLKDLFTTNIKYIDHTIKYILYCQQGYRSTIAYTLFQKMGIPAKVYRKSWNHILAQQNQPIS